MMNEEHPDDNISRELFYAADDLRHALMKPTMVLAFALSKVNNPHKSPQLVGAWKAAKRAAAQIDRIVMAYAEATKELERPDV